MTTANKPWYTDAMVDKVARDMHEDDAEIADACDVTPIEWKDLDDAGRARWTARAIERLMNMTPLDLTRPLRMRCGVTVEDAQASPDGLSVIVRVPAWGTKSSWPIDGKVTGTDGPEDQDLVYADADETSRRAVP
jgi:hypothetical protein